MADAIWAAASGAVVQDQALNQITHDLANLNTSGFKASQLIFIEAVAPANAGADAATSAHAGVLQSVPDWSQGTLMPGVHDLDVGIDGAGFFVVLTAAGERLTRSGSWRLGSDGILRDSQGNFAQGQSGLLQAPPDEQVSIDQEGVIRVQGTAIDRLKVVDVPDRSRLKREQHGLWNADGADPFDIEAQLRPGTLEASNVSAVGTMAQMVNIHRAYESYHRVIESTLSAEKKLVNELR